jgi:anti-sigma regulatory factor (Ser/Thr protein kinase)
VTVTANGPDVWLSVPARAENVAVVRQALAGLCEALAAEPRVVADVKLAVTEACTNVVVHAYPEVPNGVMEVEARPDGRTVTVIVRDHGQGIVPRADSPGLGLGLPMIASLSDSVEIRGGTDEQHTEVIMTFALDRVTDGGAP